MNKIKELRKESNITVAELAKELGISQSMLTNYENGNGTPRDESIWEKLSQIFGVSKSHVMGLTTDIETTQRTRQNLIYWRKWIYWTMMTRRNCCVLSMNFLRKTNMREEENRR